MKKVVVGLMALGLILGLSACGEKSTEEMLDQCITDVLTTNDVDRGTAIMLCGDALTEDPERFKEAYK